MKTIILPTLNIVGISTRTINAAGQSAVDIEKLWQKFWTEQVQGLIPNKIGDDIYAVYTAYETDFTGAYSTIIGLAVSSLDAIPKDMVGVTIEATNYHKIVSTGKMPDAIANTWFEIWANEELNSLRAYKADFTVHGAKYYDGDHAQVETYISVKESSI